MSFKDIQAAKTTLTRDLKEIEGPTGNIFESIVVLSRRADQVNLHIREELNDKLSEFATATDNLEEIFENREQIEISKFYERLPKPTAIAIEEFLEGKIYYRNPALEAQEENGEEKAEA